MLISRWIDESFGRIEERRFLFLRYVASSRNFSKPLCRRDFARQIYPPCGTDLWPAVPRLRTRSKAPSVQIPGNGQHFYRNTFTPVPEFVPLLSLSLSEVTARRCLFSLSLSLSDMIVARPDLAELGRNFVVTFPRTNFPGKRKMNYYPSGIPVNPGFLRCKSLVEAGNSALGIMQRIIGLWRNWNRLNWS